MLVIWNRYGHYAQIADRFDAVGAAVIVAENGLIGHSENAYAKQFDPSGAQLYTLALDYHNGGGRWWVGEPGRWREQGIQVHPWRQDGEHILVLPQRGFGHPKVAPPANWIRRTLERLQRLTRREIVLRPHPANEPAKTPLSGALRGAWAAVTWGSGAAIKAICAGVPVFSDWQQWIGAPCARPIDCLEAPLDDDRARERMLDRLAWLQWTVPEIATGEPFRRLLSIHQQPRSRLNAGDRRRLG